MVLQVLYVARQMRRPRLGYDGKLPLGGEEALRADVRDVSLQAGAVKLAQVMHLQT